MKGELLTEAEVICPNPKCGGVVLFQKRDLLHYRHDVDGNNVYITCPDCSKDIPCSKQAMDHGWVPNTD